MHLFAIPEIRFRVQVNATVSLPGLKVAKRLSNIYLPFISVFISDAALKFSAMPYISYHRYLYGIGAAEGVSKDTIREDCRRRNAAGSGLLSGKTFLR
jgi:hypothetical protein